MEVSSYKRQLLEIILTGLALVGFLVIVEIFKRRNLLREEAARKSIHIGVGAVLATLPLFMDRWQIVLTNAGFFLGVLIFAGLFHIFTAVHAVKRWTIGEFIYPLSTGLVALLYSDLRIYVLAVFILAFADGLAGLIGRTRGRVKFRAIGGEKSWLGSSIFLTVSMLLITGFWSVVHASFVPPVLLLSVGLFLTMLEAGFSGGFDNLTVPLGAAFVAQLIISI